MLLDLSYQTKNAWIERALTQLRQRTYRPGLEPFGEQPEATPTRPAGTTE